MGKEINESGFQGEELIENFLKKNGFAYNRNSKGIDFEIFTKRKTFFVDSKNQNSTGSVDEKLPQTARKYWRKYNYKDVYIVCGKHKIDKEVIITLKEDEVVYGYKTHIMEFQQFSDMMLDETPDSPLDEFFT